MKRKPWVNMIGLVILLTGLTLKGIGQQEMKVTEINVFKNGTYFVVKEGNLPIEDYHSKMELPPSPLMGTFWLTTQKDLTIERLVFMVDTIKKTRLARSITDLSGTLADYFTQTNVVKIRTVDGKTVYFPASDVRQLFVDDNPNENMTGDSTAYLARIQFSRNIKDARIKLVYMQPGIQWIPSYNIKILNDKELQIEMKALVENFAEVIKDAQLTLTVGNPNYHYGRTVEPFASPYLTNLGGNAGFNTYTTYQFQNTMAPAAMMNLNTAAETTGKGYADYQEYNTASEKTGDLFMYDLGKVSIPKNSKASFQVFSQKIMYKDVYKASISDVISYYSTHTINNDPERKYDVYHSLKLTNSTKNPFTTAPVFVMDENLRPLAQDEISYTPVSGSVSVNLSKSPDIILKNNEEEKNREEKAKTIDKHTYSKITIKGLIEIQNTLDKKVILNVDKSIIGLITEVSDNGKIISPPRFSGLNPSGRAEWEINLEGNEKKTLSYTYEVYILVY
ncbi:MAG: hypothetical protein NTU44_17600 [Bacteroidetes bacterium]|nr:hypothetical protein [Bacteroidota bacterium]